MKVSLKKYGDILLSRPSGKEALKSFLASSRLKKSQLLELDFNNLISVAPSWLDEFVTGLRSHGFQVQYLPSDNPSVQQSIKTVEETRKVHPWRFCPTGQHWVRDHDRSNTRHGVHGYCRHSRSGKDEIQELEMDEIASKFFNKLEGPPCSKALGFSQGNKFDDLIRGWTRYWNEVLQPPEALDPNLVKVVISTESSFRARSENPGNRRIGKARGLMQITEESWKILKDVDGELKNHFVVLDQNDLYKANQNICAGIRWLFRKKETASAKLNRQASWIETVAEYKSYLKEYRKNPNHKKMAEFIKRYETLRKC